MVQNDTSAKQPEYFNEEAQPARRSLSYYRSRLQKRWTVFWMRRADLTPFGRFAARLAVWYTPPYKERAKLARYNPRGYISAKADIVHRNLHFGQHVFVDDYVVIYQPGPDFGAYSESKIVIGDRVKIYRNTVIAGGAGGELIVGNEVRFQNGCRVSAYKGRIVIGDGTGFAPNCALYPYNHGVAPGTASRYQPLETSGGITIGENVWFGYGVIVLDGVTIGDDAVIGAGSVVTRDIPAGAIAAGSPARVRKMRDELAE
jgi:acetyltransferase-like isoleucine patch superfamily enzyme